MPQPLSHVRKDVGFILNSVGNTGMVQERPELAVLAMECISTWSTVESWMLDLYLDLAGGNKSVAAEMYLRLESNSTRSAALMPLIQRLEPRYMSIYAAIAKLLKTRAKARDKIAHWVWGISAQLPDALLLANPKSLAVLDPHARDWRERALDQIYVYTKDDFHQIIADNRQLGVRI